MAGITATYVDADTFTVATDMTLAFVVGRRVKCDCGASGYKYGTVESSSYGALKTTVNLVSTNDDLTSNLVAVWFGIVSPGTLGSVPEHDHTSNEGYGGDIGYVNVKNYGAEGDGSTDDTTAINAARTAAQTAGGNLYFPVGTYLVSTDAALTLTSGNVNLIGDGSSTIIKAADSADLATLIASTGGQLTIRDMVLDGNRAGGGTSSTTSYVLFSSTARFKAVNVEVKNGYRVGVFVGDNTTSPTDVLFRDCWIHDNGGLAAGGIGVGIFGGGTKPVDGLKIVNCRFEDNYNTVTGPGDSTALNLTATNVTITENYFLNNYNVNGAMVAVTDNSTGSSDVKTVITDNIIEQTGTFGSDSTYGIEINGRKSVISNNIVLGTSGHGIQLQADSGESIIKGNLIECTDACVNIISTGGTGVVKAIISNNELLAGTYGVSVQAGGSDTIIEGNYIDSSVTTPINGIAYCTTIRNNVGYGFGSKTYDPASIADGAVHVEYITVTGVEPGDFVRVSHGANLDGVSLTGYVSSSNTVACLFLNNTGVAKDITTGTLSVFVDKIEAGS